MFLAVLSITSNRTHAFLGLASVICVLSIFAGCMLPVGSSFVMVVDDINSNSSNNNNDATMMEQANVDEDEVLPQVVEEEKEQEEEWEDDDEPDINISTVSSSPTTSSSLHNKLDRIKRILIQKEYIALLAWFSTCIVPLQYYVGTIGYQLESLGDDDGYYTGLFSIIYASAAALAPFGGYLSDRLGLGLTQGLATSLSAASFYFLATGSLQLQVPGMCVYSVGRMFVFGTYFTNIGKRFGYANYGLLAGLGLMLSAIISLCQYPLIALVTNGNARQVNLICGSVLLIVGIPYCLWLGIREKKDRQQQNADSTQEAMENEATTSERQCGPTTPRRQSSMFRAPSFIRRPSYFSQ